MRYVHVFPSIMILLDLCCSALYLWDKDYWRAGYWLAAAFLTLCVTMTGIRQ